MESIKSLIGRRKFLIAGGAASTLALAGKAKAAEKTTCGANQPAMIKGLAVEKPVHPPYQWSGQTLREMTAPAAGASASSPGAASALAPASAFLGLDALGVAPGNEIFMSARLA